MQPRLHSVQPGLHPVQSRLHPVQSGLRPVQPGLFDLPTHCSPGKIGTPIYTPFVFRSVLSKTMVQGRNLKPAKSTAQKTSKKHRQQVERGRHKEGLKKSAKKVPSLPASIVASPSNRLCSREEQMNTCGKR